MLKVATSKWAEFWSSLEAQGDSQSFFAELAERYSEPHRAYHNLAHVVDCLEQFEIAKHLAHDATAVQMALWYHDVIYDPRAKDNEERSTELAESVGRAMGLSQALRERVSHLILATKKHDASLDKDAPLVVDIDLSILGRAPERFDEYEYQIGEEYDWVPREAFIAGRTAVLESFLVRPAIYSLELFSNRFEQPARENLKRSIYKLQSQRSKVS